MGDSKLLDPTQIVNSIAVLLAFFVGYKYAIKKNNIEETNVNKTVKKADEAAGGSGDTKWKPSLEFGSGVTEEEPLYTSFSSNYKMVLVVRNDLKMGKGKVAAQCGHAAVDAYKKSEKTRPSAVRAWESSGCAKIALKVKNEAEMMAIKKAAEERNVTTCLIRDAGRTQIEPNSKTVLALGPAPESLIDSITGHLKLL